ncbi:MAG: signal recognition particle subunit SRP54 [Rhodothermales bacterium]|jgi:signal recognition particle subunit SRP54
MFDNLTDRLQDTFRNITGRGKLSDTNVEEAMRDVRRALLEADVNYKIAREFVDQVTKDCLGEKVMKSITPGQQFVKIVSDRLTELMGEANSPLALEDKGLSTIMIVGLHGGGKTTSTGKLAHRLKTEGRRVLMAAMDVHRPAAIDQLEFIGKENDIAVFAERGNTDIASIAKKAHAYAKEHNFNTLILDTAGRLQIDQPLVRELIRVRDKVTPDEILLVADAALGQEAVSVATHFDEALDLTGIILTKLDGDARGGAALSMRKVTGKPIKFIGLGEKIDEFEPFHPDRMARRILGMGDVVSMVEKAEQIISEEEAADLEDKLRKGQLDWNGFVEQLNMLNKLGGMRKLLDMLPFGRDVKKQLDGVDEGALKHAKAVVQSMTPHERSHPPVLNELSRRERVARGCGLPLEQVTNLMKQFENMRQMMKGGGLDQMAGMLEGMGGMGGGMPGMPGMGMPGMSMPGMGAASAPRRQVSQKAKKASRKKNKSRRKR